LYITLVARAVGGHRRVVEKIDYVVDARIFKFARNAIVFAEAAGIVKEKGMQYPAPGNFDVVVIGIFRMIISLVHRAQPGAAVRYYRSSRT
jgi:hypothetical protein